MSESKLGNPDIDEAVISAANLVAAYSGSAVLKNQDLETIEKMRKSCFIYLGCSEKYIRIRLQQSPNINNGGK